MIGAYNLCYKRRALFVWKTTTRCYGYSVRRHKWFLLFQDHEIITNLLKKRIKENYESNIYQKLIVMKEAATKKLEQRADFEQIHKIVKIENKGKKGGKKKNTPISNDGITEKSVT